MKPASSFSPAQKTLNLQPSNRLLHKAPYNCQTQSGNAVLPPPAIPLWFAKRAKKSLRKKERKILSGIWSEVRHLSFTPCVHYLYSKSVLHRCYRCASILHVWFHSWSISPSSVSACVELFQTESYFPTGTADWRPECEVWASAWLLINKTKSFGIGTKWRRHQGVTLGHHRLPFKKKVSWD